MAMAMDLMSLVPTRGLRTTAAGHKVGVALQQVESLYVLLERAKVVKLAATMLQSIAQKVRGSKLNTLPPHFLRLTK